MNYELIDLNRTYTKEKPKKAAPSLGDIVHVSALMEDLGYSCCDNAQNLKELFAQFGDIKEHGNSYDLDIRLLT